jgi:hypothetical protein
MVMATSAESPVGTIATVIVGVTAFTVFMVWMGLRLSRSVERFERDPRYLRRTLMRGALLYACSVLLGVVLVVSGREPKETLYGLPVVALIIWTLLRAATRVKVPPK